MVVHSCKKLVPQNGWSKITDEWGKLLILEITGTQWLPGTQVLFSYKEYYLPGNLLTHTLLALEKENLEGSISFLYIKKSLK